MTPVPGIGDEVDTDHRRPHYAINGHGVNVDPATPTRVIDETESHFKSVLDTRAHGLNRI